MDAQAMFELVNAYTGQLLQIQKQYAEWTALALLKSTVEQLEARLTAVREAKRGCILPLGWGAGFLSKIAFLDTQDETYRAFCGRWVFIRVPFNLGCRFRRRGGSCFSGISRRAFPGSCIWK